IQAETKIQKRYLVAIEQDDFNALPGKFYARAFIKEYAQAVGLDPDEVLQGFDESEIASEEPATQYTRMNRTNQAKDSKGSSFLSFTNSNCHYSYYCYFVYCMVFIPKENRNK